jgi:hypothetical protein
MSLPDFALFGRDLFGNPIQPAKSGPLAERFEFPPFSVLNARDGDWQDRKRAWLASGIESGLGRDVSGASCTSGRNSRMLEGAGQVKSVFDPVLAELAYRWFCPPGGQVLDPFAGGSVRGVVAGLLGYRYHGIDLRREQVDANTAQRDAILGPTLPGIDPDVQWDCGDSMARLEAAPQADFVFSCPPYGDLERYSDDPADLSTMEYHTFIAAYKRIILRCAQRLKPNRMACFVVADFRDPKTGMYRGFVADTINAFREVGMQLYNDAVLVTAVGSLPIRVSGQFDGSRKLGKTHQNILVFAKGDPRIAFRAAA